jgi:hypothetical protein
MAFSQQKFLPIQQVQQVQQIKPAKMPVSFRDQLRVKFIDKLKSINPINDPYLMASIFGANILSFHQINKICYSMILLFNKKYCCITFTNADTSLELIRKFVKSLKEAVCFTDELRLIAYLYVNYYNTNLYEPYRLKIDMLRLEYVFEYALEKAQKQVSKYMEKNEDTFLESSFVKATVFNNIRYVIFCKENDYVKSTRIAVLAYLKTM